MSVKKNLTVATVMALLAVPAFTNGNHLHIHKFSDNLMIQAHADSGFNGDSKTYHSFTLRKPLTAVNMYVPTNSSEPLYKADKAVGTHTFPTGDNVTTTNSGMGAVWVGVHDDNFGNGEDDIHDTVLYKPSSKYPNVPAVQNGKELKEEYGTSNISSNGATSHRLSTHKSSQYQSGVPSTIQRGSWHTSVQRDKYNTYRQYPYTRTQLHVYNDDVSYASDWYNSQKQFKVAGNGWGAGMNPKYKDDGNGKYVIDTSASNGSVSTMQKIDPYDMNIWLTTDNKTEFLGTFHKDGEPQYQPATSAKKYLKPASHKATHHSHSVDPSSDSDDTNNDPTSTTNNASSDNSGSDDPTSATSSDNGGNVTPTGYTNNTGKTNFNGSNSNSVNTSGSKLGNVNGSNGTATNTTNSNGKLPQTNETNNTSKAMALGASALVASAGLMAFSFARKHKYLESVDLASNTDTVNASNGKGSHDDTPKYSNKSSYDMIMGDTFNDLSKSLKNL